MRTWKGKVGKHFRHDKIAKKLHAMVTNKEKNPQLNDFNRSWDAAQRDIQESHCPGSSRINQNFPFEGDKRRGNDAKAKTINDKKFKVKVFAI